MHLNVHLNTCISVCPVVKDATVIFCALNHSSISPLWVRVQLGSREKIQVLLAGGWVFFLRDLPFLPNLTIDSAKSEWSNLDKYKTQMKKNVCGFYDVLGHVFDQCILYLNDLSVFSCNRFVVVFVLLEKNLSTKAVLLILLGIMSPVMRKPVFGVCDQVRLKPACSATETS